MRRRRLVHRVESWLLARYYLHSRPHLVAPQPADDRHALRCEIGDLRRQLNHATRQVTVLEHENRQLYRLLNPPLHPAGSTPSPDNRPPLPKRDPDSGRGSEDLPDTSSRKDIPMTSATPILPAVTWTDPAAVTSYLTTLVSSVVAVLVVIHPGWTEPVAVQAIVVAVGFVTAGVAQIVNIVTHRQAQVAAIRTATAPPKFSS